MMARFSFSTFQYSSSCPCLVVQQQVFSQQCNLIQGVLAIFPIIVHFPSLSCIAARQLATAWVQRMAKNAWQHFHMVTFTGSRETVFGWFNE
jgi:hypothetical protein